MPHEKKSFVDRFTKILVEQGVMQKEDAVGARKGFEQAAQGQFVDFLLEEGLVEPEAILQALSTYYQVPSFDVRNHFFDQHLLHMFPKGFLLRQGIIPLERDQNMLIVVASHPEQEGLEAAINQHVSYNINFYVGIRAAITDMVKEFYDRSPTQVVEDIDIYKKLRLKRDKDRKVSVDEIVTKDEYKKSW